MEATVQAATIAAIATLAVAVLGIVGSASGAVFAWVKARSIQRQGQHHARDLETLREQLDKQRDEHRAELENQRERLRGEIARDLAANESALRVNGELRLRMLTDAMANASEFRRNCMVVLDLLHQYAGHAWENNTLAATTSRVDPQTLRAAFSAAARSGAMLPPTLDNTADAVRAAIAAEESTFGSSFASPEENISVDAVDAAVAAFDAAFRDWKQRHWDQLVGET